MQLITSVHIEGLRSIQSESMGDTGSINVLVGRNSSGKSNTLRALNIFFNGEIEPEKPIDFARDHYEQTPRKRKKKRIRVKVSFKLPRNFRFRKELASLAAQLTSEFVVSRTWELDHLRKTSDRIQVEVNGEKIENGENMGRQFLSLITYRYIPNRTVPSDILRAESQAIASSIFGRMKGDQHAAALLESLNEAARRMLTDASESLSTAGAPLEQPSVSTAETIGEMLKMSGFQATGQHGVSVQDEDWGAGHQSFFLYQVLKSLDTSYSRFFGWKQATIWGVEEPEAALHRDLESRLAEQFRNWCLTEDVKLQVFVTTHSPVFTMAGESGFWVELNNGETKLERLSIPELTRAADTRGVGGWVHPILFFPWSPVVLVEGQIDADVLTHVARLAGCDHIRFTCLPQLDSSEKRGGKEKIDSFLKNSMGLAQNRSKDSPFMVLLDWDVSNEALKITRKAYGKNGDRYVCRMDPSHCDKLMSDEFKGIERFYPPKIIEEAHKRQDLILGIQENKPYSIAKEQLDKAKGLLRHRILEIETLPELTVLLKVVLDIDKVWREPGQAQLQLSGLTEDHSS